MYFLTRVRNIIKTSIPQSLSITLKTRKKLDGHITYQRELTYIHSVFINQAEDHIENGEDRWGLNLEVYIFPLGKVMSSVSLVKSSYSYALGEHVITLKYSNRFNARMTYKLQNVPFLSDGIP